MNSDASDPALIGIDWGTSSLRAFLIGAGGEVLQRIDSDAGIMKVPASDPGHAPGRDPGRDFDAVLARLIGPWEKHGDVPVLASGMITSRNGWIETPYVQMPVDATDLANALVPHRTHGGRLLHFVTGAVAEHTRGPDVMRGEEVQIIGAVALGQRQGLFVMPGTHSKWVQVEDGRIIDFSTYMTGELFAVLTGHTILGTLMEQNTGFEAEGFEKGVAAGLEAGANLLHDLFHVRTLPLLGKLPGDQIEDYLSGLLIGTEIAAATRLGNRPGEITIVGRSDLSERYELALRAAGLRNHRVPDDIIAKGHFLIAQAAGLIG